jgi:spore photoproduct lyase
MFAELNGAIAGNPARKFRIGTGEFTDSLALDRLTGLSKHIVPFFANFENAILELKTKSAMVDNLQNLAHNGRTVVAWSLNSSDIMEKEEIRSATLQERLEAARKCAQWGYKLAFHFDPIIDHPNWQEAYQHTIDQLFANVPAEAIVWISLGALRYIPKLKETATARFPRSRIYYHEFVQGLDGKARYFRSERVHLYQYLYSLLKEKITERCCIYFCMESDEVWREVMGFVPEEKGGIPAMLDRTIWPES